jgi:hypothetical protein
MACLSSRTSLGNVLHTLNSQSKASSSLYVGQFHLMWIWIFSLHAFSSGAAATSLESLSLTWSRFRSRFELE